MCIACQNGGEAPTRLSAYAWREAARKALPTIEAAIEHPREWGFPPPPARPGAEAVRRACRRIARCYRGAAYAVEASRGFGERAP